MAQQGESGVDAVVRDAAKKHEEQQNAQQDQSEFDAIARLRGASQEKTANVLAGHLHSPAHQHPHATGASGEGDTASQLQKSSDAARERVMQANDKTYDAIEEARKAVKKKFEEAKQKQAEKPDESFDDIPNSYSAINEAKEELKEKFGHSEADSKPDES